MTTRNIKRTRAEAQPAPGALIILFPSNRIVRHVAATPGNPDSWEAGLYAGMSIAHAMLGRKSK